MKRILSIFLSLFIVAGCATFGGDLIIRVSGSLPLSPASDNADKQCRLSMASAGAGEQGIAWDIPAEFSTSMMVVAGSKPKSYCFVAECDGGRKFRSKEVIISSRSSYSRTFDVGTLVESVP